MLQAQAMGAPQTGGMPMQQPYALPAMTTPTQVLPGAIPSVAVPNGNSSMPVMQVPNGIQPVYPQQNMGTQLTPGVAAQYSNLNPGAVQAAFANVQNVPQQWQPFAQAQPLNGLCNRHPSSRLNRNRDLVRCRY